MSQLLDEFGGQFGALEGDRLSDRARTWSAGDLEIGFRRRALRRWEVHPVGREPVAVDLGQFVVIGVLLPILAARRYGFAEGPEVPLEPLGELFVELDQLRYEFEVFDWVIERPVGMLDICPLKSRDPSEDKVGDVARTCDRADGEVGRTVELERLPVEELRPRIERFPSGIALGILSGGDAGTDERSCLNAGSSETRNFEEAPSRKCALLFAHLCPPSPSQQCSHISRRNHRIPTVQNSVLDSRDVGSWIFDIGG